MIKHIHPLRAVIAFGSNLGDRAAAIDDAVHALGETPGVTIVKVSSYRESIALTLAGRDESAPPYLNAVAIIETTLDAEKLLDVCQRIENEGGRVRAERWGSRTIDIDIIDFAAIRMHTDRLVLPHPEAHNRDFVLAPWLEIDPEAMIAGVGTVSHALESLDCRHSEAAVREPQDADGSM